MWKSHKQSSSNTIFIKCWWEKQIPQCGYYERDPKHHKWNERGWSTFSLTLQCHPPPLTAPIRNQTWDCRHAKHICVNTAATLPTMNSMLSHIGPHNNSKHKRDSRIVICPRPKIFSDFTGGDKQEMSRNKATHSKHLTWVYIGPCQILWDAKCEV